MNSSVALKIRSFYRPERNRVDNEELALWGLAADNRIPDTHFRRFAPCERRVKIKEGNVMVTYIYIYIILHPRASAQRHAAGSLKLWEEEERIDKISMKREELEGGRNS